MRIAIVAGHFTPELGYQEVYLARAYARHGHHVRVISSTSVSLSARKIVNKRYPAGLTVCPKDGFEILRLKTAFRFRSTVLATGLKAAILSFDPDLILLVGLRKLFGVSVLSRRVYGRARAIGLFGDAGEYRDRRTLSTRLLAALQDFGFLITKQWVYRKSVQECDKLVMNIPETEEIFLSILNENEKELFLKKRVHLNLGFDSREFYFSEDERFQMRASLRIAPEEIVLVTSTRVLPSKRIEEIVALVSSMHTKGIKLRCIIIGFLDDDYARELKHYIGQQSEAAAFHCFPFLPHHEIRRLFCAADIGLWMKAAISIQEAMGTGLPVILERKPSVSHLIQEGVNGWYFNRGRLPEVLAGACKKISAEGSGNRAAKRKQLVDSNYERFSYDVIAQKILQLGLPVAATQLTSGSEDLRFRRFQNGAVDLAQRTK